MNIIFNKYFLILLALLIVIEVVIKVVLRRTLKKYDSISEATLIHEDEIQKRIL